MSDQPDPAATVHDLIERSHRLGSDPRVTNYAGGNTSAKGRATDPATGADIDLLWVKGSGGDLATLRAEGLACLRLDRLRALTGVYPGPDREDDMVAAFDYCLHGKGGGGAEHRHGDARTARRPPRRPPAPGCRDRARHVSRRGASDERDLR